MKEKKVKYMKSLKGFLEFIREQGVVGLAVGFLLGGAVSKVVASLVSDIINPIVGIFLGATGGLKDAYIQVGKSKIMWGDFISNSIDFLFIAFIVYYGVKVFGLHKIDKKKK